MNDAQKTALKDMVDRHGVRVLLYALAEICAHKVAPVREQEWHDTAEVIEELAAVVRV